MTRSSQPREAKNQAPARLYANSMRHSYLYASKIDPQATVVKLGPVGTRGMQLGPGTMSFRLVAPASAGRPAPVREGLIFASALLVSQRRRYASAASRSTSAFRKSGYGP